MDSPGQKIFLSVHEIRIYDTSVYRQLLRPRKSTGQMENALVKSLETSRYKTVQKCVRLGESHILRKGLSII